MFHAILYVLPAILLAIPLALHRYPGERVLLALDERRRQRRPRPRSAPRVHRVPDLFAIRGGRLVATSLAARPPPSLAPAS